MHKGPTTDGGLTLTGSHPVADGDRVVLADDLAEVAGRGQMMIQPAIDHQKRLSAGNLAVDDPGDVNSRFADQIAAQFDDQLRCWHLGRGALGQAGKILADRREIEPVFSREVGNPESATQVEKAYRRRRISRQSERQFIRFLLRLADRIGPQVLRPGEKMKPFELQSLAADLGQQGRYLFRIDAELLGSAAHLHSRAFQLEVRVNPHRDACRQPQLHGNHGQFADFAEGFDVDQDARRDRLAQFATALAGAGKADFRRIRTGIQRHFKLPSRSDIDAIDQARHDTDQRRHRVGFHRVVQLDGRRECGAQFGNARPEQTPVIGIERCLADPSGKAFERHATDQQLTVGAANWFIGA